MHILIDNEKVIRVICNNDGVIEHDESGVIWINGAGYALVGQQVQVVHDIPINVVPDKYKYIGNEFVINTGYYNHDEALQILIDDLDLANENIDMLIELQADILGGAI